MIKKGSDMKSRTMVTCGALIFVLSIMAGSSLYAWEMDKLVDLNYFYIPDTDFKDEEGKMSLNSAQVFAMLPVSLSEETFLTFGLDYQGLFADYKDMPSWEFEGVTYTMDDFPDDFHAIDLIIGLVVRWTDEFSTYAEFRPGVHSNMEDVTEDDVCYQGGFLLSYVFSDSLTPSLGAFYDDSFGEPELYPAGGVQWQISDALSLDTILPDYLVFAYQADSWLKLGLRGRLSGHQFRLTKKKPWDNTVLKYEQILLGPFVDFILGKHLVLKLEGGMATARSFEFRDDDSSEKLYDGDVEDGGYVSISAALQY